MQPASFIDSIRSLAERYFEPDDPIGVAFSGGADSLSLCVALKELGRNPIVALHCNFHLRGAESDADTLFCENIASVLDIPLHIKHFPDVKKECERSGESLEMVCRRLRYNWFDSFTEQGYIIALGHHAEDNRETMMLNLLRGTGIKGLTGMDVFDRGRRLWRPLLGFTKEEITGFLEHRGVPWRTDSSNLVPDVLRNRLRLKIMPCIYHSFPDAAKRMNVTITNLRSDSRLIDEYLKLISLEVYNAETGEYDLAKLKTMTGEPVRVAFGLFSASGFNWEQCEEIVSVSEEKGYREFISGTHVLFTNGNRLKVFSRRGYNEAGETLQVNAATLRELATKVPSLDYEELEGNDTALGYVKRTSNGKHVADTLILDIDKICSQYPSGVFEWRSVKPGDRIAPFGMHGKTRLISDILSDAHATPWEKREARVLTVDGIALWLYPYRTSSHFTVDASTKRIALLGVSNRITPVARNV